MGKRMLASVFIVFYAVNNFRIIYRIKKWQKVVNLLILNYGLRKPLRRSLSIVNNLKIKTLLPFLYFTVQIETENYKLIYESQFRHFIKRGKICITFGTFYDQFELQPWKATKFFSYFWLHLARMKSTKKPRPRFLITFLLFEIWANIKFCFLWSWY